MGQSKYDRKEHDHQVYVSARNGLPSQQIADLFKVHKSTLYDWRDAHESFAKAWQAGKDEANMGIAEKSLLRRVTGFYSVETKSVSTVDDTGKPVLVPVEAKRKYHPPSDTAIIFWLTNRFPERWPNYKRVSHSGESGKPIGFEDQTKDMLKEMGLNANELKRIKSIFTAAALRSAGEDKESGSAD